MDGAASDDEEISALGASPARPRAGGSAASSPTLSLPESFSNLGGEPAPLARQLESELAATHERRAAEREAYHARLAAARRDADAARRQADAQAVELARATEALRDRRDAIDDGFRDGLAYAVDAGGDEAATASVRALVDELRARPADELTLRELATVRVVEASERTQAARLESARAALDAAKRRDAAERAHERLRAEHEGLAHGAAQREQLLRDDLARVAAELEHARRREAERAVDVVVPRLERGDGPRPHARQHGPPVRVQVVVRAAPVVERLDVLGREGHAARLQVLDGRAGEHLVDVVGAPGRLLARAHLARELPVDLRQAKKYSKRLQ